MMGHSGKRRWAVITPKPDQRTVRVSLRLPEEVYAEVSRYAEKIGSDRTYVIVECLRRALRVDRRSARPATSDRKPPARARIV
jgi:hypothetical protein